MLLMFLALFVLACACLILEPLFTRPTILAWRYLLGFLFAMVGVVLFFGGLADVIK